MTAETPANLTAYPRKTPGQPTAPEAREVLRWNAGWASGVFVAGLALAISLGHGFLTIAPALSAGIFPAVCALALARRDSARIRDLLLVVWALAGALGAGLSGGVSGPLAIWCLAPVMAGAALGGARRLAQGAALALLAVVVTGLARVDRLIGAPPTGTAALGLGLIGVTSMALGLAAALLAAHRRAARVADAQSLAAAKLNEALVRQPNLILTLDEAGRVETVFGGAAQGIASAERLMKDGLLASADEADRAALRDALAAAIDQGVATRVFRAAGDDRGWLAIDLRRLSATRLIATLRDASAERTREAALEQARADAEALNLGKSRFLANMSHELRTPLNAIMGFSDIMRQRMFGALPSRYGEYADLIHDAGAHLLDLINDVLDVSKIEAARYELSLERLDAREPIQAALRLMRLQADDAGVQLRGVLANHPLDVDADRRAVKQIALNLVSNALKFTPKGGLVTVSLHSLAGALELTVADTGLGIAADDLKRLGQPYEQAGDSVRQGRGTGLGLSLVRAFAELHGGEMAIESRLGEGTAVTVRLPMAAAERADQGDIGDSKVIAFNPQR